MKYELKISQAAELLSVSESRISQLIANGALDSVTIRGQRRISRESVEAYRDNRRGMGRPPKAPDKAERFVLMNADYEVLTFSYNPEKDLPFDITEVLDETRAPWGTITRTGHGKKREFNAWWRSRAIPNVRPGLGSKLASLELSDSMQLPFRNLGLSLSDCYWVRRCNDNSASTWADVNYFDNPFDEIEGSWDFWLSNVGLDSPDNTSEGMLPKRWTVKDGDRVLLKGCRTDDQRPFNEIVATGLHRRLLPEGSFVEYWLENTADGPACACKNFLAPREEYIPAAYLKETIGNTSGLSPYDRFCRYAGHLGMDETDLRTRLSQMMTCDIILANTDRHWRNFGFVRNIDTLELRPAPSFDTGNCLWYDKTAQEMKRENWHFFVKPFGPETERQLAAIDKAAWFDASALDGFVEEAVEILSGSRHVMANGRMEAIVEGLQRQIDMVAHAMKVSSFRA